VNIQQSVVLQNMRDTRRHLPFAAKERKSAQDLAKQVFARAEESGHPIMRQTRSEWVDEWLQSKDFVLLDISLGAAACPNRGPIDASKVQEAIRASADCMEPVIIDVNKNKIGFNSKGKFFPPVIVVDGQHNYQGALLQGRERIKAWVGLEAAAMIGLLHADHQLGSSELHQLLQKKLREAIPSTGDPGSVMYSPGPYIKEVYPLEDYFVYNHDDKQFKQSYKCNVANRTVDFVGKPRAVVQKFVHASSEVRLYRNAVSPMERAMQIHGASGGAGMGGAPSSSLGNGSGAPTADTTTVPPAKKVTMTPTMPAMKGKGKKKKLKGSGYFGYNKATKKQSQRMKAPADSEMGDELKGSGYYGYKASTKTQSDKTKGGSQSEVAPQLQGAATVRKIVTKFKAACAGGYKGKMQAVAPPGMEHVVKGLKKHFKKGSASPFKLAWWMHDKKKGAA
jgi:hypothetical protein